VVFGDLGIDHGTAMRIQPFERPLLVGAHQPRIARHVSGKYRS
jgi:hypothetical protein